MRPEFLHLQATPGWCWSASPWTTLWVAGARSSVSQAWDSVNRQSLSVKGSASSLAIFRNKVTEQFDSYELWYKLWFSQKFFYFSSLSMSGISFFPLVTPHFTFQLSNPQFRGLSSTWLTSSLMWEKWLCLPYMHFFHQCCVTIFPKMDQGFQSSSLEHKIRDRNSYVNTVIQNVIYVGSKQDSNKSLVLWFSI